DVPLFRVGDLVACSGVGYASHAAYNVVPHQLLTPVPENVSLDEAAFVSLGAIAMQGVRRAEPSFGETFVVIGLGLVGQITFQIVQAAGCHVIGCDPVEARRDLAASLGCDHVCAPEDLERSVQEYTAGYGADAVLVCASAKNSSVANQALHLCRSKGRVVVVGAVGMHLERGALYENELDFMLSCSYGPGRYDRQYEEGGLDYPIGYVRWTQGRNMAEFLRMVDSGRVKVKQLISLSEAVERAEHAYEEVMKGGAVLAALIRYHHEDPPDDAPEPSRKFTLRVTPKTAGQMGVAVIGTGAIATAFHLPNLAALPTCRLVAVANRSGQKAKQWGSRFNAAYCTTDYREVLQDSNVDAVIIATRHHLHKEMALAAIEAGKHVFVEKPLALTVVDCDDICAAAEKQGVLLTVGFNRRFAPLAVAAQKACSAVPGPKTLIYRCNAGPLPPNHWALDPVEGGGRIRGEAVHFFDFARWFLQDDPVEIQGQTLVTDQTAFDKDSMTVTLRFSQGSLATVLYGGNGSSALEKERIEIFANGTTSVIDDFKRLSFYGLPNIGIRHRHVDKGLGALLAHFIAAVRGKESLSITGADGRWATFIAEEALKRAGSAAAHQES
ncbi:MAG: Gfo/Idh/MocA family oxidoreductase, partial [Candidatus Hydrogenedentes bacterium]|nr:Gfo/Idh/MocA family oxidoreductase [Candidatus Hydrogenedentota bacterium]